MIQQCDHVFCLGCLEEVMHQQAVLEEHQGFWICPTCEKMFQNYTPLHAKSRGTDYDDMEGDSGAGSPIYSEMKIYSKGLDMRGFEPQSDTTWVPKSDSTPGFKLAPSVKTATLKAILLKGFHEAPLDKVSCGHFFQVKRLSLDVRLSFTYNFAHLHGL